MALSHGESERRERHTAENRSEAWKLVQKTEFNGDWPMRIRDTIEVMASTVFPRA